MFCVRFSIVLLGLTFLISLKYNMSIKVELGLLTIQNLFVDYILLDIKCIQNLDNLDVKYG